jgi:hypothetical protein
LIADSRVDQRSGSVEHRDVEDQERVHSPFALIATGRSAADRDDGNNGRVTVSKRSIFRFKDFASDFAVLRMIDEVFDEYDLEPLEGYEGAESGMRRGLVGAYIAALDLNDPAQERQLVTVVLDAVDAWGRDDKGDLQPGAVRMLGSLRRDGFAITGDARWASGNPTTLSISLDSFDRLNEPAVVDQHLQRIARDIESDPAAAIGSSKELVESVCRFILDDYGVTHAPSDGVLDLYKLTAKEMKLNRDAVPDSAKGSAAAQRTLQNLATAVQSLAELRNELGTGHGKTKLSPAFARHARLSFNASRTVVEFLLETWHERKRVPAPA